MLKGLDNSPSTEFALDQLGESIVESSRSFQVGQYDEFHTNFSQDAFYKFFLQKESQLFPGVFDPSFGVAYEIIDGYYIFAPSYHVRSDRPVVTTQAVLDLRNGLGPLLSVGAGPAYTERLLTTCCGIDPSTIFLADIDPKNIPPGFSFIQFDMHQAWPELPTHFKHIVFLESTLISLNIPSEWDPTDPLREKARHLVLLNLLRQGSRWLLPDGEMRMSVSTPDKTIHCVLEQLEKEVPDLRCYCMQTPYDSLISVRRRGTDEDTRNLADN